MKKLSSLMAAALLLAGTASPAPLTFGISCDANCPGGSIITSATALGVKRIRLKVPTMWPLCDIGTAGVPHAPICENATNSIDPAGVNPSGSGLIWQLDGASGTPFANIYHVGDLVTSAALPGLPGTATITTVSKNVPSVTLDTTVSQYVQGAIGNNTLGNASAAAGLGMTMELTLLNISDSNTQHFGPVLETDDAFKARVEATIAAYRATGITIDLISVSAEEDAINNNPDTPSYLRMLDLVEAVAGPLGIPVTNGGLTNTGTALVYWDYLWETCATVACRREADVFSQGAFIKSEFQSQFIANKLPTTCDGSGTFLSGAPGNLYNQMRKFQALMAAYATRPWMAYTNLHAYQVPWNSKTKAVRYITGITGHPPYFNQFNNYSASAADQLAMMEGIAGLGAVGIEPTVASPTAQHTVSLQQLDGTLLPSGVVFKAYVAAPKAYSLTNVAPPTVVC